MNPLREALIQMKVENRHTCELLDVGIEKGTVDLFEVSLVIKKMERDLGQDIRLRTTQHSSYSETDLMRIFHGISYALFFAKCQGIAHRDIKPQNLFIDGDQYVLGNFGFAYEVEKAVESGCDGTLIYLSPQLRLRMTGTDIDIDYFNSDVFALGVTLVHLMQLHFSTSISMAWRSAESLNTAVEMELSGLPYSYELLDLVRQMLKFDPEERLLIESLRLFVLRYFAREDQRHIQLLMKVEEMCKNTEFDEIAEQLLRLSQSCIDQRRFLDAETVLLQLLAQYRD